MKADETLCNEAKSQTIPVVNSPSYHGPQYQKVLDGRNQQIRGLYQRCGTYYGRLDITDSQTGIKKTRWVRLTKRDGDRDIDVTTVADAKKALERAKSRRDDNTILVAKRTPKFVEYADTYLAYYDTVKHAKKARTIKTERGHINAWKRHLGPEIRIDKITLPMIRDFMVKREKEGANPRTINLGVTVLRNILHRAIDDGWISRLPTENIKPLRYVAKKKRLLTFQEIESICKAAMTSTKNGQELSDYIYFLSFSGCRRNEALCLKWSNIDFAHKQLTVGEGGVSKNHESRTIDFNDKLEQHLKELYSRRAPDSEYVFPSPMRGNIDKPARSLVESMRLAKNAAGIKDFGFHSCRHFFASFCVMSGVDYLTIAKWLGHKDGGVLIGKVYGHLNSQHTQLAAKKVRFEPVALDDPKEVAL